MMVKDDNRMQSGGNHVFDQYRQGIYLRKHPAVSVALHAATEVDVLCNASQLFAAIAWGSMGMPAGRHSWKTNGKLSTAVCDRRE